MTHRSMRRMAAATAASLAAVMIAGLVPAQAGTAPDWRVVKEIGPAGCQNLLSNVVATGSRDAWAAGDMDISCGASLPLVEHWNGTTWQQRPLPAALDSYDAVIALGASSASNAWLIAAQENSHGVEWLTWNGSAWRAAALPGWAARISFALSLNDVLSVFGPANVWNFSLSARQNPALAARFNGHSWRRVYLPGAPVAVSAVAARDIWAVGPTRKTMSKPSAQRIYVAMHWNGRRWRTITMPKIRLAGVQQVYGLAAGGPRSLWATMPTGGPSGARRGYLIHWDGKRWHRVRTPRGVFNLPYYNPQATDGHGGVWLQGFGPAPADAPRLYHYSHGHWTTYRPPAPVYEQFQALTLIPGTRSEWGVGESTAASDGTAKAVIAKYGP
jgi:hypothetical protein